MPTPKDLISGRLYVIIDQLSEAVVDVAMQFTERTELILALALLLYALLNWIARFLRRNSDADGVRTEMENVILSFVELLLWITIFGITRIVLVFLKKLLLLRPFLAWHQAAALFVLVTLLVFTLATKFSNAKTKKPTSKSKSDAE